MGRGVSTEVAAAVVKHEAARMKKLDAEAAIGQAQEEVRGAQVAMAASRKGVVTAKVEASLVVALNTMKKFAYLEGGTPDALRWVRILAAPRGQQFSLADEGGLVVNGHEVPAVVFTGHAGAVAALVRAAYKESSAAAKQAEVSKEALAALATAEEKAAAALRELEKARDAVAAL